MFLHIIFTYPISGLTWTDFTVFYEFFWENVNRIRQAYGFLAESVIDIQVKLYAYRFFDPILLIFENSDVVFLYPTYVANIFVTITHSDLCDPSFRKKHP